MISDEPAQLRLAALGRRQKAARRHAGKHGRHEDERSLGEQGQRGDGRSGAKARQAPADTEDGRPDDHAGVDLFGERQAKTIREDRAWPAKGEPITNERDRDRSQHDEGKARVKGAEQIEEVEHLRRVDHARDDEPKTEQKSGERIDGEAYPHQPPSKWRATKTVANPAAMKIAVATMDRGESRAIPQTPWPLVQP